MRLVSRHTVEEVMLFRAYRKLHLKHEVLDKGKFSNNPNEGDDDVSSPSLQL